MNWPLVLAHGPLTLRPLRKSDAAEFAEVRRANRTWLQRWDATSPDPTYRAPDFQRLRRILNSQGKRGQGIGLAMVVDGHFRGQITVNGIQWGSLRSATMGYWIDHRVAGQGFTPLAVAMLTDHCLFELGLHRVEINIRPENQASLRVAQKLQFRDEGLRRSFMHINGRWADHRSFALVAEDVPGGLLHRYLSGVD